jgi:hypothetical protein
MRITEAVIAAAVSLGAGAREDLEAGERGSDDLDEGVIESVRVLMFALFVVQVWIGGSLSCAEETCCSKTGGSRCR